MNERKKQAVNALARRIRRMRLETPALLMLEAHLPLARLCAHALAVAEPVAAGLMGLERVRLMREILFDAECLEMLMRLLEEPDEPAAAG